MGHAIAAFLRSPGQWSQIVIKHGPAWVLLAYLIHFLTSGVGSDVRAMSRDHQELGFYMRQICIGVNKDNPNAWQVCQPPGK